MRVSDLITRQDAKKTKKRKSSRQKNQDQMKGSNEDQGEEDEHVKDFSTSVNDGRCGKIFQCLNLKYCILGEIS